MTDTNTAFCRILLSNTVKELREKYPRIRPMKDAWVWTSDRRQWEFHAFDNTFYRYFDADNAYDARAKGWDAWMMAQEEKD